MSRSERLLDLLQLLRRHRAPVGGQALADALGVSLRTLYRDIGSLRDQGARIEGEPGIGFQLKPGFLLPPLMFDDEEIEALVLGAQWVAERTDGELAEAARQALARIAAVLPEGRQDLIAGSTLLIGPGQLVPVADGRLAMLRKAIRREQKLDLDYRDEGGQTSSRRVWPFGLGFFDEVRILIAWCELRCGFRHFRVDRIAAATLVEARYPEPRLALLRRWRATLPAARPGDERARHAADRN